MQQAADFRAESISLFKLLEGRNAADFDLKTQFKGWTVNDVIGHLHMFNVAARLTLEDALGKSDAAFPKFFQPIASGLSKGQSMMEMQQPWLDGLTGRDLFFRWNDEVERLATLYSEADPKLRLEWAGPEMAARSSITARQMETWAHGQEIFDVFGKVRQETDRLRNIAHLGVSTFGWTYIVREQTPPEPAPHVRLYAPSGAVWSWNETSPQRVEGRAVEFCQVVTQTRNIADTSLETHGDIAKDWMAKAQCFAGAAHDPPPPGTRFTSH